MRHCVALLVLFTVSGCGDSTPKTLVKAGYDEQEMEAAIARARSEVDVFVTELASPTGTDHAVKAPVEDGAGTKYFWLTDVTFQNGAFQGTIGNDPGIVSNLKIGQDWTVKMEEISDWMFMRDGKIHGNYTIRAMLKAMPEDQAAEVRAMLAER